MQLQIKKLAADLANAQNQLRESRESVKNFVQETAEKFSFLQEYMNEDTKLSARISDNEKTLSIISFKIEKEKTKTESLEKKWSDSNILDRVMKLELKVAALPTDEKSSKFWSIAVILRFSVDY